ncbi:sensor histidine kinase [Paenibacillus cellulositrophicus]|uniref:sensor histidine kinase n=1 Tax=Paenibacillus cellulositrophicus TaxID=562959 RepID=UPI00203A42EF|nr:sensor histidine kinase [Paenibacillus cellulositrophicus]
MRLFLKEHIPLLIVYLVQIILVGTLFWLGSDTHSVSISLYSAVLITVLLFVYLTYRYLSHRRLYQRLSEPAGTLDQSQNEIGESPLADALHELLENQFQLYQNELYDTRQRLALHTAFINRWVHQMKTPISVIQLTLQDMDLDDDEVEGSLQEELDKLRKGLEMALHTSRLDRFEHDFRVDAIPLRSAVQEAVADNRRWFIRNRLVPDIRIDEELAVYSDAKWFHFMLGQVITNAVTYSAGRGERVVFAASRREAETVLEITDQGVGIRPEDLGRVFEPYYTGSTGRNYHESTGMGLYLVREVCSRLGHRVEIDSAPEQGTTVRFVFDARPVRLPV